MVALKQTLHDEGYKETAEAFAYTTAITHMEWDLDFLGEHLVDQITEWHVRLRADQPLTDERPARPPSPTTEPQIITPPPPEFHPEQVIEGDQMLAVRVAKSDGSIDQIENLNGILDRQE